MAASGLPWDRFAWCDDPVRYWAVEAPGAPAVRDAGIALDYAGLDAAVDGLKATFAGFGVQAGDRVCVLGENSVAAVVALLAAARLRAWAVPLNARLLEPEVANLLAHCRPRLVVTTDGCSDNAAAHGRRLGATDAAGLDRLGARLAVRPDAGMVEPVSDDPARQVAALIYTSGTTGAPKGVMLTHDNLMFIAGRSSVLRRLTPADRVYAVLPTSHVFGLASVVLGSLYQGAELRLVARFEAKAAVLALAEDNITVFQGVPQMYAAMLALGDGLQAPALRYASAGGAPLDPGLKRRVEAVLRLPLANGYGLTETSPTLTTTPIGVFEDDANVGPAIPDVDLHITAPDGREAAAGTVGEIRARGRAVMKGYYRDPDATAAVMASGGWFKTGDLGRIDDRGRLHVVGRLKEVIIRSGFNVYPPEVEGVLSAHPDVAAAAVIGGEVKDGNEAVVAFVQTKPGRAFDEAALAAFAAERLAPYKRPSRYVALREMPTAATGKLLKHKLRNLL